MKVHLSFRRLMSLLLAAGVLIGLFPVGMATQTKAIEGLPQEKPATRAVTNGQYPHWDNDK